MTTATPTDKPARLVSLDAYRGFVMLAMASSGLAFANVVENNPDLLTRFDGKPYGPAWRWTWETLAYQFEHVAWTGCAFWDLIQPSFMFMVGVAMPFSYARRTAEGQSRRRQFGHVLLRSFILIALGIFLSSQWSKLANFTFVNVLTQIGLGYTFLWLLLGRRFWVQMLALAAILAGSWSLFSFYETPSAEREQVTAYLREVKDKDESEWTQFTGFAAPWNKHLNAAAAADRRFLNLFPRNEEEWNGRQFWVNDGGYQTLNFLPSMATMLLGLMAGQMLRSERTNRRKFWLLVASGAACFLLAMSVDTTIWPVQVEGWNWTVCPAVKRIWTPTWAVFSSGWTFVMLAGFFGVIDILGCRRWAFPLVVVGMNSIAMYVMSQTMRGWIGKMLEIWLGTVDAVLNSQLVWFVFGEDNWFAPIAKSVAILFVLWLICLWLYRQRIFVRI